MKGRAAIQALKDTAALCVRIIYPHATGWRAPIWRPPHGKGLFEGSLIVRGTGGHPDTEAVAYKGPRAASLTAARVELRRALLDNLNLSVRDVHYAETRCMGDRPLEALGRCPVLFAVCLGLDNAEPCARLERR